MVGKVVCIAIGMYAGILLKQRYKLPQMMSPGEMMDRMRNFEHSQRREDYVPHTYTWGHKRGDPCMWERFQTFQDFERWNNRQERPSTDPDVNPA